MESLHGDSLLPDGTQKEVYRTDHIPVPSLKKSVKHNSTTKSGGNEYREKYTENAAGCQECGLGRSRLLACLPTDPNFVPKRFRPFFSFRIKNKKPLEL